MEGSRISRGRLGKRTGRVAGKFDREDWTTRPGAYLIGYNAVPRPSNHARLPSQNQKLHRVDRLQWASLGLQRVTSRKVHSEHISSAAPPIAAELVRRSELTQCARFGRWHVETEDSRPSLECRWCAPRTSMLSLTTNNIRSSPSCNGMVLASSRLSHDRTYRPRPSRGLCARGMRSDAAYQG